MPTTVNMTGGPGSFVMADDFTAAFSSAFAPFSAALIKHTQAYETSFGEASIGIPGSPRNSLASIADTLLDISNVLEEISSNQTTISERINSVAGGITSQNTIQQRSVALQQASLVDQMKENAINQAEARAALARVGIDPQPLPDLVEIGKELFKDSLQLGLLDELKLTVTSIQNDIISGITDYIKQLSPVVQAKEIVTSWFANLALVKAVKSTAEATRTQARAARAASQAAKRTGTWRPAAPKPLDPIIDA